ncbi:MAG: serine/threonine-protein kinase [Fibrobacterota bacterium]
MKWLRITLIALVLFGLQIIINRSELLNTLDSFIPTGFYRLRGEIKPGNNIVLAAIDDVSINEIGDWPWKRGKIAELIDSVSACDPAVIFVNIFFRKNAAASDESSVTEQDNTMLINAIQRSGNVVLPYFFERYQETGAAALPMAPPFIASTRITQIPQADESNDIMLAGNLHSPEPRIAEVAAGIGFNNIAVSADGYSRFAIQTVRYGNDYYTSVSLQIAGIYRQLKKDSLVLRPAQSIAFKDGPTLPINLNGTSMINYYGPAKTFPHVSAAGILGKNFNKDLLKERIVIIGITDLSLKRESEARITPFSEAMPATEIWANIIENTIDNRNSFINFSSFYLTILLPLLIFIGLAFLTDFSMGRALSQVAPLVFGTTAALIVLSFILFLFQAWLPFYVPLLYLGGFFTYRLYRRLKSGPAATVLSGKDDLSTTTQFSADGQLVRIHRYKVIKEIGSGAMGTVYKAVDPTINRVVAIKTVRFSAGQHGGEMHARFHREAQAAGGLSHPNIVTIFDFGDIPPLSYIAMEYLEGVTLEQKLADKNSRPSVDEVIRIISQVADGLTQAHAAGIVHRDIKPGNIMLVSNGALVKIMDFGVAKLTDATLTETGKTLGTPHYMSPEQIRGEVIDSRSDLFSLAAMAYEALVGKRPFIGDNLSTLSLAIVNGDVPDILLYSAETNAALNAVFRTALAKERDDRYATAVEFARAFATAFGKKA